MIWAAATDPTLPANITAVGALIGIVWWLVKRADSNDERRDTEVERLRKELSDVRDVHALEVAKLNAKIQTGRDEIHDVINRATPVMGAAQMARTAAENCTCGAMAQVVVLMDQLMGDAK